MSDPLLLTGLSWATGAPRLRVRQPPAAPSTLVDLIGFELNYRTGPAAPRRCLGHRPFRRTDVVWSDCDGTPLHDGRKCDRCAASDATFASQLHHAHTRAAGELDPAVLRHLETPNDLYLAAFRDGSVKVGTSTVPRREQRLHEQGAWIARIVVNATDGFAVRSLEDRISAEFGLPQSVSIRRKLEGLQHPRPDAELTAEIDLWTVRIHELLADLGDSRLTPSRSDWLRPGADDPIWLGLHPYPLKLESGAHHVRFLAASGRAAVIERPGAGDRFIGDLRPLYGVELEVGDFAPDPLAVQDALF